MAKIEQSVHGFIANALKNDLSQRSTMRDLRAAGFKFSDQTFRSLWAQIEHASAIRGDIASANPNRRPLASEISPISGHRGGGFLYRFDVLLRRRGEREVLQTHVGIRSSRLVTYNTAAQEMLTKFLENEDQYGSMLIDWIPAAVNELMP